MTCKSFVIYIYLILLMLTGEFKISAKRMAPAKVLSVVFEDMRFDAPNLNNGKIIYLVAHSITDNTLLYQQEIYRSVIEPELEEDVQWDFAKSLTLIDHLILIVSEKGKKYYFDPKSRQVSK